MSQYNYILVVGEKDAENKVVCLVFITIVHFFKVEFLAFGWIIWIFVTQPFDRISMYLHVWLLEFFISLRVASPWQSSIDSNLMLHWIFKISRNLRPSIICLFGNQNAILLVSDVCFPFCTTIVFTDKQGSIVFETSITAFAHAYPHVQFSVQFTAHCLLLETRQLSGLAPSFSSFL